MTSFKQRPVQPDPNVQKKDLLSITLPMINRMKIEDKSDQTITSYVRAVERLVRFHDMIHPRELDVDEVLDFLVSLNEHEQVNWRTSKMYGTDRFLGTRINVLNGHLREGTIPQNGRERNVL
ncbi:MAG: hypothetical protein ACJATI_003250 [Halioglobus sp.]|jgi:hypothetical protein